MNNQLIMVTSDDYQPTNILSISRHFVCVACERLVFLDGRECGNMHCQVLLCSNCVGGRTRMRCPKCHQNVEWPEINRKVKNIMEMFKINCPGGCGESFLMNQLAQHMEECEMAKALKDKPRQFATDEDFAAR